MWGVHYRKERVAFLNAKDEAWQKELADSQGPLLVDQDVEDYDDTTSGALHMRLAASNAWLSRCLGALQLGPRRRVADPVSMDVSRRGKTSAEV